MTNHSHNIDPTTLPAVSQGDGALEELDLTPAGLADAPAHQQEPDSLVHTGNS